MPRLDVAAHYQPVGDGAQAGGDFYDLFPAGHGAWVGVLGTCRARGPRRLERAHAPHPARRRQRPGRLPRALALADEILHAEDEDRLCSAVLVRATVSLGRARLKLANAGHPPPMVLRADGSVASPRTLGSILGVSTSRLTQEIGLDLEPGDALVLFTDGVTEARPGTGCSAKRA